MKAVLATARRMRLQCEKESCTSTIREAGKCARSRCKNCYGIQGRGNGSTSGMRECDSAKLNCKFEDLGAMSSKSKSDLGTPKPELDQITERSTGASSKQSMGSGSQLLTKSNISNRTWTLYLTAHITRTFLTHFALTALAAFSLQLALPTIVAWVEMQKGELGPHSEFEKWRMAFYWTIGSIGFLLAIHSSSRFRRQTIQVLGKYVTAATSSDGGSITAYRIKTERGEKEVGKRSFSLLDVGSTYLCWVHKDGPIGGPFERVAAVGQIKRELHFSDSKLLSISIGILTLPIMASLIGFLVWRNSGGHVAKSDAARDTGITLCQHGVAMQRIGKFDEAAAHFNESIPNLTDAIRHNPTDSEILFWRGVAWDGKGRFDKAIADFDDAIRLNPDHAETYYNRALAKHAKGELSGAIDDYNEATQRDNKLKHKYIHRIKPWVEGGGHGKVIEICDEMIELDPELANAFHTRGVAWSEKKEFGKAIADYNVTIRLDPNFSQAFVSRGSVWSRQGAYRDAITDFKSALRIDSNSVDANRNLAWIFATCPDSGIRDGRAAYQHAMRAYLRDNRSHRTLDVLAAAHAENDGFEEAVRWQEESIKLSSGNENAVYHLRLKLYKASKAYRSPQRKKQGDATH